MVEPLISAIEVWLAIWNNLPFSVQALANLTLGLFIFVVFYKLFIHIRG